MENTYRAYAKINYNLFLTGRREDGYHLLDTLMQTVSLYDMVTVQPSDEIELVCDRFPGRENLAFRAAELLRKETGCGKGVKITLEKRIPSGAGLGGGSSDAACVLNALNEFWGLNLPQERLAAMALTLGADVPFFLSGGLARCRGVGELLTPLASLASYPMLLLFPGQGVSTPECYRAFDRSGRAFSLPTDPPLPGEELAFFRGLHNDLEQPASELVPELTQVRTALEITKPLGCSMSGSGSAFFALYAGTRERDEARKALSGRGWALYDAEPVCP